ncbi:STAS domain-containing protein [Methylomarinum sp. Ch1-1]|uniref:Anti-sigma factor antagonist n=1 Tax=Methylomarinum roseum TaxID=3067653 RepID=A0AAU7NXT7_9GAMM|nr:STAS domain-containing protein [Methylomarinum sp. Ch1-1]MDP4522112.1 STAS domain-containing protein [Methylomarinum sp. Ch1-1]
MNLKHEKLNGYLILQICEERIDAHNSVELKETVLKLIEQGEINIVVKLDQVRFIDSSGLGALLSGFKNAAARSGKLVLSNIQNQVLSMFELTRLNRVFEIYADISDVLSDSD